MTAGIAATLWAIFLALVAVAGNRKLSAWSFDENVPVFRETVDLPPANCLALH